MCICVLAIHMGTVTDFGVCVWACVCGGGGVCTCVWWLTLHE